MKRSILEGKRVLITGATGFIGSNLLRRCIRDGADVSIFIRKDSNLWRIKNVVANVKKLKVDLLDRGAVEKSVIKLSLKSSSILLYMALYPVS